MTVSDTCGTGDVDTSRTMSRWVPCHDRALYEAQSTQDEASGLLPLPVCSRHAEDARRYWSVLYIRPLVSDTTPGTSDTKQGEDEL